MIKFDDESIKKVRKQDNFVPAYSAYAYEKKKHLLRELSVVLILVLLITIPIEGSFIDHGIWWVGLPLFLIEFFLLVYSLGIFHVIDRRKWLCGYLVTPTEVRYLDADGRVRQHTPNQLLRDLIMDGEVCYKTDALRLGKGKDSISFPYEVGRSTERNHISGVYKTLEKNLGIKLPTYKKKDLELLDRRYYYRKSCVSSIFLLAGAIIVSFFAVGMAETTGGLYIFFGFIGLWEAAALAGIHGAAMQDFNNYKKIQCVFQDVPHPSQFGFCYRGPIVFAVSVIVTLMCDLKLTGLFGSVK